ncbi:acetyl-CoA C-acetyltransferase [Fictibacillus aquaticus]|uniref:acetyl-CoA C-acetyltransferase n=1 Tax=Fictibacillus aquaticus TaxID=2021314 RepID=A0A235FAQ3_9BACL|nr:acetyl-CoA C-acetyltransferase [Fictibacillus aquaticus]OYD58382.1 beta-ketoadipyl CoA thiolase [Fictibacillus aquaticus]
MQSVFLMEGARTAFGAFGKQFKDTSPVTLGSVTALEAIRRANVEPGEIEDVVYGNVIHSTTNAAYVARHIALRSGIPQEVPAMLVNRLCGSGLQAAISSARTIMTGDADITLCGGVDNMSMSPHASFSHRFGGQKYGTLAFEDMLLHTLTDQHIGIGMGITAENLAREYGITREQQDEYAILSQQRAYRAAEAGKFAEEIIGVPVKKGEALQDESIKGETSSDQLASLRPSFEKDGTVTAGNSSTINDGAATLILAGEKAVYRKNMKPIARIVSWAVSGVDPSVMGIGPVPAIKSALARAGLLLEDMDLVEVNEAFSAQYLAVEKELHLDRERTNINGGAIALGHPVGASGARILLTLSYELRRQRKRYGLASLCIGGGQGIAMIIENVAH